MIDRDGVRIARHSYVVMTRAEYLLGCAIAFREAPLRSERLPERFDDVQEAVCTMTDVLLHEARESTKDPMDTPPDQPFMHPVDLETEEPGIVDQRDTLHVLRADPTLPRRVYARPRRRAPSAAASMQQTFESTAQDTPHIAKSSHPPVEVFSLTLEEAKKIATEACQKVYKEAEKKAATAERRAAKTEERKQARANETAEEKAARLEESRRKRFEAKQRKEQKQREGVQQEQQQSPSEAPQQAPESAESQHEPGRAVPEDRDPAVEPTTVGKRASESPDVELFADVDASAPLVRPRKRRVPGAKLKFHAHPLPHDRHLHALSFTNPCDELRPAILRGETSDRLLIIQGPPGTGKTKHAVECVASLGITDESNVLRVFACAPTNVGAANLYSRFVSEGLGGTTSLCLMPERVPPGTVVQSNDPCRRIVCGTVSSRSGPLLQAHNFDVVVVDEAGQVPEAWLWGLLRSDVQRLIMAGDVKQLPSVASETGTVLSHERSMMERLLALKYDNTIELLIQHRMCPALLEFPNLQFYDGRLSTGEHAPSSGSVSVHNIDGGREEADGTSFLNRAEAQEAARVATLLKEELDNQNVVIITPYAGQVRLLLAKQTGCEVHTIDSFQGREAAGVVLSCVRDGTKGLGFWSDHRRITVALTRAKVRLALVTSNVEAWEPSNPLSQLAASHF